MKYPKHIILDVQRNSYSPFPNNWKLRFEVISPTSYSQKTLIDTLSITSTEINLKRKYGTRKTNFTNFFDIHFLRKERLYTKLKYSRCPQYDIVSGGFAAILAGFIGFLISEKFGIELVDSGDFYNAGMYLVFAAFFLRPIIRVYSEHETPFHPFSLKYLVQFLQTLLTLFMQFLVNLYRHVRNYY